MSQTWFKNLEYRSNATQEKVQIKHIFYVRAKLNKIAIFFVGEAASEPTVARKKCLRVIPGPKGFRIKLLKPVKDKLQI